MTLSRTARIAGMGGYGRAAGAWLLAACAAAVAASMPVVAEGQTAVTWRAARAMGGHGADEMEAVRAEGAGGAGGAGAMTGADAKMEPEQRAPFGAGAGKAGMVVAAEARPARRMNMTMWVLSGVTAGQVAVLGIAAMTLSRRKNALGHVQRSMTLGAKIAIASGGLATLVLASLTLSAWERGESADVEAGARNARAKMLVVGGLGEALAGLGAAERGVCAVASDESLRAFSDAAATVDAQIKIAIAMSGDSEQTKALVAIASGLASREGMIKEIVKSADERMALASGTMRTTADLARGLMEEAGGVGVSPDRALAALEQGREAFWNYLVMGDEEQARAAAEAAVQAGELSRMLAERTKSKWRSRALHAAAERAGEWAEGVLHTAELQGRIDRAVKALSEAQLASGERLAAARERAQAACTAASQGAAGFGQGVVFANFGVAGLAVLAGSIAAFGLGGSVTRAGARVVEAMRAVGAGDLTRPPLNERRGDEMGELARAADELAAGLRDVMEEVAVSTADVVGVAGQIAANAGELSKSVGEVVRGVARASADAAGATDAAKMGHEAAGRTAQAMRTAGQAVAAAAQVVAELGLRGEQIVKAVGELQELSDRINLSAMNASIEAAKAGGDGAAAAGGLPVVAGELRALSEQTTGAIEAVSKSIRSIRDEIGRAIERATGGGRHIDEGIAEAERAGACMERLAGATTRVAEVIRGVSAVGEEAGTMAGRSAAGVTELSAKAEQLMSMVNRFKFEQGSRQAMGRRATGVR